MVASVKKNMKFRQLAGYSVQSLAKLISAPAVGWERNLREAYDAGALAAITEVLTRHAGDEEVQAAAVAALTAIATEAAYSEPLIESGVILGLLESILKNPDAARGVKETIVLFENAAMSAPNAMLMSGGLDAASRLIDCARLNAHIAPACARVVEKLVRDLAGPAALVECGGIPSILNLVVDSKDSQALDASFKILERMVRVPEYVVLIRDQNDGLKILCKALATLPPNDTATKTGSRLLSKLASSNVGELVSTMLSAASLEREYLASLISTLVLEEVFAAKLLASGGLLALLKVFGTGTIATSEATAKAMVRLTILDEFVGILVEANAIELIVSVMKGSAGEPGLQAACTPLLARIAAVSPEALFRVNAEGGVEAVVRALAAHATSEAVATTSLAFFESIVARPGEGSLPPERLFELGALVSLAEALAAHPSKPLVQLNGSYVFIYCSGGMLPVRKMIDAGVHTAVLANLATPSDDPRKDWREPSPELIAATMYLATQFALLDEGKAVLGGEATEAIMSSVSHYTRSMGDIGASSAVGTIAEIADALMMAIVTEKQVTATLAQLRSVTETAVEYKTRAEAAKLRSVVTSVCAFAANATFARILVRAGGTDALLHSIELVSAATGLPDGERILALATGALSSMVSSTEDAGDAATAGDKDMDVLRQLVAQGAPAKLTAAVKAAPKLTRFACAALDLLTRLVGDEATVKALTSQEGGAVEACSTVLRANQHSVPATISAVSALLAMADEDNGAIAVAKLGGTRQILANMTANVGNYEYFPALERSLALLARCALVTEGAELIVRQGGVDAMIEAASSLSRHGGDLAASAEVTLDGLMRVLSHLLTRADVISTAEASLSLASEARLGGALDADRLRAGLIKLPVIASVPRFAEMVRTAGAESSIAAIVANLLSDASDAQAIVVGLPLAFKSLAALARTARLQAAPALLSYATKAIRSALATPEALELIRSCALFSEVEALRLCHDGTTLPLVVATLETYLEDKNVSAACFRTLAALGGHPSTVSSLAATTALSLAKEWLADNADDASEESIAAALSCLGALAGKGSRGDMLVNGGLLETLRQVLNTRCGEEAVAPAPLILGAAVNVLSAVARLEVLMAQRIASSGVLSRVVRSMQGASAGYSKNESAVVAACNFFTSAANAGGDLAAELNSTGAIDVILAGMSTNGTSDRVLAAGGEALEAMGAGEEAARIALEEVRALNSSASDITELGSALQRLSNLAVVRGVVTTVTAMDLLDTAVDSMEIITEDPSTSPGALVAALQSVGRVVERGGVAVDDSAPRAVDAVLAALTCRRGANLPVRLAAIHALGQLTSSRTAADKIILANVIQTIRATAKKHAKDSQLQSVSAAAIKKIMSAATRFAANGLDTPEGLSTLSALLAASVGDPDALDAILGEIIASQCGIQALFQLIANGSFSNDIMCITLAAINSAHAAEKGESTYCRVGALIRSLEDATMQQATLTARSSANAKFRAIKATDSTLGLLSKTAWSGLAAARIVEFGGLDKLVVMLKANWDDAEKCEKITAVIRGLTAPRDWPTEGLLRFQPHMRTLNEGLRRMSGFASLAAVCNNLEAIVDLAGLFSAEERLGWQRDTMRSAASLARAHPGSGRIISGVRALEAALGEMIADPDAAARAFEAQLLLLIPTLPHIGVWQEIPSAEAENRSYFFDPTSNETTWITPLVMANFKSALFPVSASGLALPEDANIGLVNESTMLSLVGALNAQIRSPVTCEAILNVISALALNEDNVELIGIDGILAMIAAANAHPHSLKLLRSVLVLMERISRMAKFREIMAEKGGVDLLLNIAFGMHCALVDICLLALQIMSNLSVELPSIVEYLMKKGAVKSVEKVLQDHAADTRLLQECMSVLTNLMYGSETNKLVIGQTCGDEITDVIKNFPSETSLIKQALKALGNLSFCDENVRFLAEEHHATKAIVATMRAHGSDEEVQELAMDVMTNFAAAVEGPEQRNADGDVVHSGETIAGIILREAGCAQIIATLKNWRTTPVLLVTALRALATIASDIYVVEIMCERQSLLTQVFEVAAQYTADAEVLAAVFHILSAVTKSKTSGLAVIELDGVALAMSSMEQHRREPVLLRFAQLTLTHISACREGRDVILAMDGISTLLALLEESTTFREFAKEVQATLLNLCANDALSRKIAESGMHILISLMSQYEEDAEFLTGAFRLMGHLAFLESNLAIIVQHNGIQTIIRAITLHPDSRLLMVRSIQTLDNIAMKNREYAGIVIEEGGKELIETIMTTYEGDEELHSHGRSALLAISALEGLSKSAEITAKASKARKRGGEDRPVDCTVDSLGEFRNVLAAGKVFKVWTKGSSRVAHVVVSSDFRSIVWQEVGSTRKLGAIDLKAVLTVKLGSGDGHKRGMLSLGKAVDDGLAFCVVGERNSLDLEAATAKERDTWYNVFTRLLNVYRTNPGGLSIK